MTTEEAVQAWSRQAIRALLEERDAAVRDADREQEKWVREFGRRCALEAEVAALREELEHAQARIAELESAARWREAG